MTYTRVYPYPRDIHHSHRDIQQSSSLTHPYPRNIHQGFRSAFHSEDKHFQLQIATAGKSGSKKVPTTSRAADKKLRSVRNRHMRNQHMRNRHMCNRYMRNRHMRNRHMRN